MKESLRVARRQVAIILSGVACAAAGGYLGYEGSEREALRPMQDGADAELCATDLRNINAGDLEPASCKGVNVVRGIHLLDNIITDPDEAAKNAQEKADSYYVEAGSIREAAMDVQMDVAIVIWGLMVVAFKTGYPPPQSQTRKS